MLKEVMTPKSTIMDKLRILPLLADMAKWFPKKSTSRGECQEVVWRGKDADLSKLPILTSWPADGGAFITLPMVCTKDPETGVPNMGMYRMQIFDNHTTGMHWHRHKTGARHYDGYKRLGKRMPVSVAIGGDPVYAYSATAPMPDNMDEMLLAGMLRQRPVKMVKFYGHSLSDPDYSYFQAIFDAVDLYGSDVRSSSTIGPGLSPTAPDAQTPRRGSPPWRT
jgi:4-hydroxy-3-polyprenylbenzoate decarboxylase